MPAAPEPPDAALPTPDEVARALALAETAWPAGDLESVAACPVCGETERRLLHDGLVDWAFLGAPGRWRVQKCMRCGCGYLDPRPTAGSIGRAYVHYYTHHSEEPGGGVDNRSAGRLKQALIDGYSNRRFGTRKPFALVAGYWLVRHLPGVRLNLESYYRFLPRPRPGDRMLDYGCGNGDFLPRAREAGWEVLGIDPDPAAAAAAARAGLQVLTGGPELLDGFEARFGAITLSHVLEHTPDPADTLKRLHRALRPGGFLFVQVPNLDSPGHRHFGPYWRGLEIPRHLVHFRADALRRLLRATGFVRVKQHPHIALTNPAMFAIGRRMRRLAGVPDPASAAAEWAALAPAYARGETEFLTLTAYKAR